MTHARPDSALSAKDALQALVTRAAERYRASWGVDQVLDWFEGQNGFFYLFDSTPDGTTDLTRPANRVVAAWGHSRPDHRVGDRRLLRRFPLPRRDGRPLDRGHLIALASGGGENVNLGRGGGRKQPQRDGSALSDGPGSARGPHQWQSAHG